MLIALSGVSSCRPSCFMPATRAHGQNSCHRRARNDNSIRLFDVAFHTHEDRQGPEGGVISRRTSRSNGAAPARRYVFLGAVRSVSNAHARLQAPCILCEYRLRVAYAVSLTILQATTSNESRANNRRRRSTGTPTFLAGISTSLMRETVLTGQQLHCILHITVSAKSHSSLRYTEMLISLLP